MKTDNKAKAKSKAANNAETCSTTQNVIIGTAGHIDHGKTALIKAITGVDADRLPEEKARGLTIDIGFAFCKLDKNTRVNFIDVPGHERFIKNMLAGATGIDAAMLVIAADDGIMPQTREHMEILELLDIKYLLAVITKCDLVDKDWLDMLNVEAGNFLFATKFTNSRIVHVSSSTGSGIKELKTELSSMIAEMRKENARETFRLPIDRSFSMSGFGSVVTGSVIGGEVNVNDEVELLPAKTVVRVRGIEVNGIKKEKAVAGQRAALNLAGIKAVDVNRGCELSEPGHLEPVSIIAGELCLHANTKNNLVNRTRVRFHIFTNEIMGRVILLDKDVLKPGETCLAEFRLEKPIVAERDDRYIIRSYSPAFTIGGGRVLRASSRCLKRFKKESIAPLQTLADGDVFNIIESRFLEAKPPYCSTKEIRAFVNRPEHETDNAIENLVNEGKLFVIDETDRQNQNFIHAKHLRLLKENVLETLKKFHKENAFRLGMDERILKSKTGTGLPGSLFSFLIAGLISNKKITLRKNKLAIEGFDVKLAESDAKKAAELEETIKKHGFCPEPIEKLIDGMNEDKKHARDLLCYLVETEAVIEVNNDLYYHSNIIGQLEETISNHIKKNGSISVSGFRDITKTTRKYAVPLLEYFDKTHLTKRVGDNRVLYS